MTGSVSTFDPASGRGMIRAARFSAHIPFDIGNVLEERQAVRPGQPVAFICVRHGQDFVAKYIRTVGANRKEERLRHLHD